MRPRGSRRHALTLACLLACVGALPAFAHDLLPLLVLQASPRPYAAEQALRQLEEGDFEGAVATLQRGLDQPDLSDDELAELYRVLGLAQLYLGREGQAREAYEKLLQAQPDYELPAHEAPKIRRLYARIKEDIKGRRVRPVTLRVEAPATVEAGGPVAIDVRVQDLALGSRPRLYYRRAGRQSFSSVDFKRDPEDREHYRALIPSFELPVEESRYEVEYYVEVADAAQRRLAGRGDALNPEVLVIEPRGAFAAAQGPAWYQTPWPYVVGGAVVVGVAAGRGPGHVAAADRDRHPHRAGAVMRDACAGLAGGGGDAGAGRCGPGEESLPLGFVLQLSAQAAVPLEQIAAFEVGAVRGLPNNDCLPLRLPAGGAPRAGGLPAGGRRRGAAGAARRAGGGTAHRALHPLAVGGRPAAARGLRAGGRGHQPARPGARCGRPLPGLRVRVRGPGHHLLGAVRRRTAELNLHESYTACQPILP